MTALCKATWITHIAGSDYSAEDCSKPIEPDREPFYFCAACDARAISQCGKILSSQVSSGGRFEICGEPKSKKSIHCVQHTLNDAQPLRRLDSAARVSVLDEMQTVAGLPKPRLCQSTTTMKDGSTWQCGEPYDEALHKRGHRYVHRLTEASAVQGPVQPTSTVELLERFEHYLDAKAAYDAVLQHLGQGTQLNHAAVDLAHARRELAEAIDQRFPAREGGLSGGREL